MRPLLSLRYVLSSQVVAPSSDAPLAFAGADPESTSRGEAKRCVSMRAEKRLRVPEGGLESLSVKEDSEQERRFLETMELITCSSYMITS